MGRIEPRVSEDDSCVFYQIPGEGIKTIVAPGFRPVLEHEDVDDVDVCVLLNLDGAAGWTFDLRGTQLWLRPSPSFDLSDGSKVTIVAPDGVVLR